MKNATENQPQGRVLVIDDERPIAIALRRVLMSRDLHVEIAHDGAQGLELLRTQEPFDLILLDICMPGLSGMQVLRLALEHDPLLSVIMITGHGTVETAVEALKLGAFDYMTKPFPNIFDMCEGIVMDAVRASQARRHRHRSQERHRAQSWDGLMGRSLPMQKLFWQMEGVAEGRGPVLLQGETGTGKLTVARALYQHAEPDGQEIRCVDCASTPVDELEELLFGSTGEAGPGSTGLLFQEGALYLGEWVEMDLRLQGKLVEVLRQETLRPWLFAASTESARRACEQGQIREDLYHRMATAHLVLPPLREREGDVTILARHFLREVAQRRPGTPDELHAETLETLEEAPWYGNVQELRNAVERAALSATEEKLLPRDLPAYLTQPTTEALSGFAPELVDMDYAKAKLQVVADFEQRYLVAVMERTSGNVSQAARQAGMDRSNFRRLLKRHQLRN
jgi:two-component system response regulator HydG